jgi:hypothetical protein
MMDSYMKALVEAIGPEKLVKNPALPQVIITNPKGAAV